MCELDQCNASAEFAHRSGLKPFECCYLMSLTLCPKDDAISVDLKEETLTEMVKEKWFGETKILTFTGVVEGISTYYEVCSMMYRLMQ
ncbi:hypothetical protein QQF64_019967 [Cirrhinus molitorella]|uniref:Uncharacterized protein n=1 Tax=Cirrhinus molitorella TaxID=172907 RepID=A0ABR3LH07_9TELE